MCLEKTRESVSSSIKPEQILTSKSYEVVSTTRNYLEKCTKLTVGKRRWNPPRSRKIYPYMICYLPRLKIEESKCAQRKNWKI